MIHCAQVLESRCALLTLQRAIKELTDAHGDERQPTSDYLRV